MAIGESVPEDQRNIRAAERADLLRRELVSQRVDFAFETVFSRTEYWLEFLRTLSAAGYEIWVFFICTESASLNMARIEYRVLNKEGHAVPPSKVASRFPGSIRTAVEAKSIVEQLWIYDNTETDQRHRLVARFIRGKIDYFSQTIPSWAQPLLL